MRAAQLTVYGDPPTIQINDVAESQPAPDEVLVAIKAASVNPFDVKLAAGIMQDSIKLTLPATLGGDFAGIITSIGESVTEWQVGQEVYGQAKATSGQGSWAEYAPVKAASLAPKPSSLDFTQAAAVPLVAVSAYMALVETMQLQAGQRILIHGGAGGIGSIAIQLAKHLGATVATTVAAKDIDFVKGLGADQTIDYEHEDFSTILHDFDAVFDTIGGETNHKSYSVLKPGGHLVSMAAQPDEALQQQFKVTAYSQFSRTTTERLNAVTELIEAGVLQPIIDKTFPLDDTTDAMNYLKSGHPRGKVVLTMEQVAR